MMRAVMVSILPDSCRGASMTRPRARFRRMTTHAVGIDMIEIERVGRVLERYGERFLRRVYTPAEAAFCRGRVPELAARFAAKEAVMKALGTRSEERRVGKGCRSGWSPA